MRSASRNRQRHHLALVGVCFAAFVALAGTAAQALAKAGDLDPSFGHHGKVTRAANFESQTWDSVSAKVAALPQGGTIVLAGRTLYGFEANGSILRGFAAVKLTNPTVGDLQLSDIAVDSRGRVLVAGGAREPNGTSESPEYAFVARYTPSGKRDPSFGDNGVVITDFGLPGPRIAAGEPARASQVRAVGIAVDSNGRLVLTGTRLRSVGPCRGTVNLAYHDTFVARLDSSGHRDTSFGDAGVVSFMEDPSLGSNVHGEPIHASIQNINPPVVDASDKIYLSTRPTGPCSEGEPALVGRLDSSGQSDPTFGDGGWAQVSGTAPGSFLAYPIALDPRGRLLLLAQRHKIAVVKRVLPSGVVDRAFGYHGVAKMSVPGDKLRVAGEAVDGLGRVWITGTSGRSFFVGRLTSKGQIDRHFGRSGRMTTSFGAGSLANASSIAIDARGRAVAAGTVASPRLPGGDGLALARYLGGR